MRRFVLMGTFVFVLLAALMTGFTGCFSNKSSATDSASTTSVKPAPEIAHVVATTSGTQNAYYATLDIKVKNTGAEGTILVRASMTQGDKTSHNEMPVFLKQHETHELKMTFPLVWQGGEFTSNVEAVIP